MSHDRREQVSALNARDDLLAIADAWSELIARAAAASSGRRAEKVKGSKVRPLPIDAHVIDVITEVEQWAHFLARVLIDETEWLPPAIGDPRRCPWCNGRGFATTVHTGKRWCVLCDGRGAVPLAEPNAGETLRSIAEQRIGHFTAHADEMLALAFADDARRLRELVLPVARPSGRRRLRIGARCFEKGTSDLGERIPCPGQYTVLADPDKPYVIPDIVCDVDHHHRIEPVEWQRAYRRTGDAQGAVDRIAVWHGSMTDTRAVGS